MKTVVVLLALAVGGRECRAAGLEAEAGRAADLFTAGRSAEALRAYRALIPRATDWAEPLLNAAVLARDLGQTREALRLMREAGRLLPEDP